MPLDITHGWVTNEPDAGEDVDADNLNDHQLVFSGLTPGQVLRATAAAAAGFGAIQDGDLPGTIARDAEVSSAVAAEATARAAADAAHAADTTAIHGIVDTAALVLTDDARLTNGRPPTGGAGGVLGGTFPNPAFAVDMATQAELDAHAAAADPHAGYVLESREGQANGIATLNGSGQVPDAQLPAAITRDSELTTAVAAEATARDSAIAAAIAALIASAPGLLDTLDEIAAALGDDPNFATTITTALAGKQALDAELTALAGLVSAADKLPYFTGLGAASVADFTAFGRSLVDDADASTARATLGLGTIATQAASNVNITGGTIAGITDLAVADGGTGASTAANARTNLGLVIGTDVPSKAAFDDHSARHENGGADEITIAGLDGTPVELTNHLNDTTAAHAASAIGFTPNGSIGATDVQAAIQEVRDEIPAGGGSSALAMIYIASIAR